MSLKKQWVMGKHGFVFYYDITSRASLEGLYEWRELIIEYLQCGNEDVPAVLIGNKVSVKVSLFKCLLFVSNPSLKLLKSNLTISATKNKRGKSPSRKEKPLPKSGEFLSLLGNSARTLLRAAELGKLRLKLSSELR